MKRVITNAFFERSFIKMSLNTEIIQKDIFSVKNIETGTIMSRAFKANASNSGYELIRILQKFQKYNFIHGKFGKKSLNETLKDWDLDYEEKKLNK